MTDKHHVKVEVVGHPENPKEVVLAIEAVTRSVTSGPAEGVLALLVAACRVYRNSCQGDPNDLDAVAGGMAKTLGHALGCCVEFWPERGDQELFEIANDDDAPGPLQ